MQFLHIAILFQVHINPGVVVYWRQHMDTETAAALKQIDDKIEVVYASVERTRKYMLWSLIM